MPVAPPASPLRVNRDSITVSALCPTRPMKHRLALLLLATLLAPSAWSRPITYQRGTSVLGQPNFTSTATPPLDAKTFLQPEAIVIEPVTKKVFISDYEGSRILRFSSVAAYQNHSAAEAVLGQPGFTTSATPNPPTAASLSGPGGMAFDSSGNLYVADYGNKRVLRWNNPTTIASGTAADVVIGQANGTSNASPEPDPTRSSAAPGSSPSTPPTISMSVTTASTASSALPTPPACPAPPSPPVPFSGSPIFRVSLPVPTRGPDPPSPPASLIACGDCTSIPPAACGWATAGTTAFFASTTPPPSPAPPFPTRCSGSPGSPRTPARRPQPDSIRPSTSPWTPRAPSGFPTTAIRGSWDTRTPPAARHRDQQRRHRPRPTELHLGHLGKHDGPLARSSLRSRRHSRRWTPRLR